jgi:hypothetical protein
VPDWLPVSGGDSSDGTPPDGFFSDVSAQIQDEHA